MVPQVAEGTGNPNPTSDMVDSATTNAGTIIVQVKRRKGAVAGRR
jgi:hypothetical protein